MLPTPYRIPFNIPDCLLLVCEQFLPDGSLQYLVRDQCQDKMLKATRELFDLITVAGIEPGDMFEIMKVAVEDEEGFRSRLLINKKDEAHVDRQ